jgi:predicted metal-binding membrane protein
MLARPTLGVGAALLVLTVLAWLQLAGLVPGTGAAMQHAAHVSGAGPHAMHAMQHAWQPADFGMVFAMWLVMAVAMMLPTAAPAILAFADIARGPAAAASGISLTAFAGGYLAAWWLFGVAATIAQWLLSIAAQQAPVFSASSPVLGGTLLVAAGLYQFSALKQACLAKCRSPMMYFLAHWREGPRGAFHLGLRHGVHCVGCCWALMALMLFAGMMSLAWTVALTALMLAEKVLPGGPLIGRIIGIALLSWGSAMLATAYF